MRNIFKAKRFSDSDQYGIVIASGRGEDIYLENKSITLVNYGTHKYTAQSVAEELNKVMKKNSKSDLNN